MLESLLTNTRVGFTRKFSCIYILRNHIPKILCILLTGGAYAPDVTCIATPLFVWLDFHIYIGLSYKIYVYALLVLVVVFNLFYVTLDILVEIKLANPAI